MITKRGSTSIAVVVFFGGKTGAICQVLKSNLVAGSKSRYGNTHCSAPLLYKDWGTLDGRLKEKGHEIKF